MSESDPLSEFNPLLRDLVTQITIEMAGAFDVIWTRPDAVALADGWLDGRVVFQIDRSGVLILERADDQVE